MTGIDELRRALLDVHGAIVAAERESFERKAPAGEALSAEARKLLRPDASGTPFQQHYASLLQERPEVAYAHGVAMRALRAR